MKYDQMIYRRAKPARLLMYVSLLSAHTALFAAIVPSDRLAGWQGNVGVEGGIPRRTTIYTTLPAGSSAATINTAIANCPSNQVVLLAAGNYNLSSQIIFNGKSGVTLRGAGQNSTILTFSGSPQFGQILMQGPNMYGAVVSGTLSGSASWTGGYAQGSSNIVLSSTSGLTVGTIICLDQSNDNLMVNANGYEGLCNYCGRGGGGRSQEQYTQVKAINGNTVTIQPAVYMPNWSASQSPQAWWVGNYVQMDGIEDLQVNGGSGSPSVYGANIAMVGVWNCWVSNVYSLSPYNSHINPYGAGRVEIRHCYFYGTQAAAEMSYGVEPIYTPASLFEDNIFNKVAAPWMMASCDSGNVWGYNYATNMYFTVSTSWLMNSGWAHDAHVCMNLFEGNHGSGVIGDFIHGTSSHNMLFRNRFTGSGVGMTANLYVITLYNYNWYWSAVGNILGTVGVQTTYDSNVGGANTGNAVYHIGWPNGGYTTYQTSDPMDLSTFYRHMNYDVVNKAVMYNSTNSDTSLPSSMYYTTKPAFFGSLPWPPYNPANGGSAAAIDPTNIPAGYRFAFGVDPPSGAPVNQPPVAAATASPKSGPAPLAVTFSSAGSSDPEGTALSYSWTFGDGTTSTAANPSHTYSAAGSYTALLTVSDGTNSTAASPISITVTVAGVNQPPVATSSASPSAGIVPLAVSFSSAGSSDPEGTALTYAWTFGDGSTSTAANPSHTYLAPGVYTAQLQVSDGTNQVSAAPITVTVGNGATGLVAAYGFEEGTGTALADASGSGNAGTASGTTWTTSGRYGNALSFNGTSSMVTVNDSTSLDLTSGMTLEAWVYPTTLSSTWSDILYKGGDVYFLFGSTPQSKLADVGGTFSSTNVYALTALPVNTWSHLAGTYDGTTLRLYVNGVQASSRAQTGAIATSTGQLAIGGDTANGQYWTGMIDEVRVYNRALSATEIQTDMNTPVIGGTSSRPASPPAPQGLRVVSQ